MSANGPSGARTLGRFCHVDERIEALVRQHVRDEEASDPEAIFAEIVHLPQGRLGNVILRPVLRDYELTYLGRSGADEDRQIPLSDLLVTVRGARTILWSNRLGKRIIPRMTNAHNFSQAATLVPYRFLAMLQPDGLVGNFFWDWGPLDSAAVLPRVRYGRCVLSRARWRLPAREVKAFANVDRRERFAAIRQWARRQKLPRLVELSQADNKLLVDFDNPLSVDAFVDVVDGQMLLNEMWPLPDDLCVSGPEGLFVQEIHVPVARRPSAAAPPEPPPVPPSLVARVGGRNVAPGSDWIFLKLYAGGGEVDRLLTSVVAPLIADLTPAALFKKWFFIRYQDPEHHLRLRFHGDPRDLHGDVLVRLSREVQPWIDAGTVSRIQLDTYQPEIERYGGPVGLDLSEQVFQCDSEAVLALLAEMDDGDSGADARWQLALRGLDAMLDDFGYDFQQKRAVVQRRRRQLGHELAPRQTALRDVLARKFRRVRKTLDVLFDRRCDEVSELAPGLAVWQRRSEALRPLAARLRDAEGRRELWVPVATLVDSYLHMYVNRIARAASVTHELVMFDILDKQFESMDARARKQGQASRALK